MIRLHRRCFVSDDDFVACAKLESGRSVYFTKEGTMVSIHEKFEDAIEKLIDYENMMEEFYEVFK